MLCYNIYYKDEKINKRPLNKIGLDDILSKQYIYKVNRDNTDTTQIPVKDIKIMNCTVI